MHVDECMDNQTCKLTVYNYSWNSNLEYVIDSSRKAGKTIGLVLSISVLKLDTLCGILYIFQLM